MNEPKKVVAYRVIEYHSGTVQIAYWLVVLVVPYHEAIIKFVFTTGTFIVQNGVS